MNQQPPLVDTHAHLDFHAFEEDREQVLQRAQEAGLVAVLIPAVDLASARKAVRLVEKTSNRAPALFVAVGVHPNSVAQVWQGRATLEALQALAQHPRVVAIGEIGLDYYRDVTPRQAQWEALTAQLELAAQTGLPVILHQRESLTDMWRILEDWVQDLPPNHPRGVLHSFSGGPNDALRAVALGFAVGITGPVTFKKAERLRQVVAVTPLEHLLVETDAPFLTPHPHRGKRNEPAYVRYVAEKIAHVKGVDYPSVARATTRHAWQRFRLPQPAPIRPSSSGERP